MADVNDNDAILKRFLYRGKVEFGEYEILKEDAAKILRTRVFVKSYAESLKNTFVGLKNFKEKTFKNEVIKKYNNILAEYEKLKAEGEKEGDKESYARALGLMYAAFKYDSAGAEFKKMIDDIKIDVVEKKEKPAEPEKTKAKEPRRSRRKKHAEKTPEGEEAKAPKEEKPPKADEKKETPAPGAPAEGTGTKGVGPAAPKAPTAPPEKAPQAGLFASKKEATKFLNNLDHTLANINANEFEVIDATYTRYKRFMGSKYEVKFEEDVAMDEKKFREIVTDTDQSSVSVVGDNRTGKPWVHIKISIPEPPEVKKDEKGNYLEYKVKRKDEYERSFSDMKWVRGMGFMPCSTGKVFKEITTTKICRKYLDGDNAGKVVVKVEKEEVK